MAWSHWIDTPEEPTHSDSVAHLPRLLLSTEAPPAPKTANPPAAQKMVFRETLAAERCTPTGPSNDPARAARAAAALSDHGLKPRQRAEEGETVNGYWVYVG